jgi:hypothetical protein
MEWVGVVMDGEELLSLSEVGKGEGRGGKGEVAEVAG